MSAAKTTEELRESLDSFLSEAVRKAEEAAALCLQIEPVRVTDEDIRVLDAALDQWLARRGLTGEQAA